MSNYAPLQIQPEIEASTTRNYSRWRQLLKWFHGFVPLRLYYEPPYGRASLEAGLRCRPQFPAWEWEANGIEVEHALQILRILQTEMNLPNYNLVPDDPLPLVMIPDYDDFPQESVRLGIREKLGVEIGSDTLQRACNNNWPISELIKLVISAASFSKS